MKDYKEVRQIVKERLSEDRFYHSECVAARCVELATIHNEDKEAARLVGIVHDIAKEMSTEEKMEYCKKNNLEVDDIEKKHPGLLHARIGAHIAKKEFGFSEDLCSSIQCHTTAKANMSQLDKVLYVADMSSQDRQFPDKGYIIELGNKDLDECTKYILKIGINQRMNQDKKIHLNSIKALNCSLGERGSSFSTSIGSIAKSPLSSINLSGAYNEPAVPIAFL